MVEHCPAKRIALGEVREFLRTELVAPPALPQLVCSSAGGERTKSKSASYKIKLMSSGSRWMDMSSLAVRALKPVDRELGGKSMFLTMKSKEWSTRLRMYETDLSVCPT